MRVLDLLFFCRPLLLIPVWTVFLLLFDITFAGSRFPVMQLINLVALSGLTAAGYVINQIFDRESDKLNSKLGFFDTPVSLSVTTGWALYGALVVLPFGYTLVHPQLFAPYLASALAGALYSAPPFKGKDRPWSGLALNAIPYSVIVWWALVAEEHGALTAVTQMSPDTAVTLGALATALAGIYLITTVPDSAGDRATGKRTIAVVYGKRGALVGAVFCLSLSLVAGIIVNNPALYSTAAVALALSLIALKSGQSPHVLLAAKVPIVMLSAFEIYRYPYYGIFLLALIALTRVYYKRRFGIIYPQMA